MCSEPSAHKYLAPMFMRGLLHFSKPGSENGYKVGDSHESMWNQACTHWYFQGEPQSNQRILACVPAASWLWAADRKWIGGRGDLNVNPRPKPAWSPQSGWGAHPLSTAQPAQMPTKSSAVIQGATETLLMLHSPALLLRSSKMACHES